VSRVSEATAATIGLFVERAAFAMFAEGKPYEVVFRLEGSEAFSSMDIETICPQDRQILFAVGASRIGTYDPRTHMMEAIYCKASFLLGLDADERELWERLRAR